MKSENDCRLGLPNLDKSEARWPVGSKLLTVCTCPCYFSYHSTALLYSWNTLVVSSVSILQWIVVYWDETTPQHGKRNRVRPPTVMGPTCSWTSFQKLNKLILNFLFNGFFFFFRDLINGVFWIFLSKKGIGDKPIMILRKETNTSILNQTNHHRVVSGWWQISDRIPHGTF